MSRIKFEKKIVKYRVQKPEAEKPAKPTEGTGAAGGAESKAKPESSSSKPAKGKDGGKAAKE